MFHYPHLYSRGEGMEKSVKKKWFFQIVLYAVGGYLLHGCANRAFYIPSRSKPMPPMNPSYRCSQVWIENGDARLAAWVLEPAEGEPRDTVLFCHGNAGNLENHLPFVDFLPMYGYRLVLFDYQGYGESTPNRPTRESTVSDVNAALDYVLRQYGKPWIMGHSLGSSLAVWVSSWRNDDVKGVVAVATFSSYRAVARSVLGGTIVLKPLSWPLGFFVDRGYDPIEAIDRISPTPILIVHAAEDRLIPERMCRELYAKSKVPKELHIVPGADHNSDWQDMGAGYVEKVLEFISNSQGYDGPES
jgi:pimeloyl-ACP methyl ester carboxylesterase